MKNILNCPVTLMSPFVQAALLALFVSVQGCSAPTLGWWPQVDPHSDRSPPTAKADGERCWKEGGSPAKRPVTGIAADTAFKKAYIECMREGGHNVIN